MKYATVFLVELQHAFVYKSKSFVWFLIPLIQVGLMLMYWISASRNNNLGLSLSVITSYYLFLVIAGSFLICHIEEDVANVDIMEGSLINYLTRPVSYFWMKFAEELPWRVLQGTYGVITLVVLSMIFGKFFLITGDILILMLAVISIILAYFLFFTYKITIGLLAFWLTDIGGFFQIQEMVLTVFTGTLMPLSLFPHALFSVAKILPFPYMMYCQNSLAIEKKTIAHTIKETISHICTLWSNSSVGVATTSENGKTINSKKALTSLYIA